MDRARREAAARALDLPFHVADLRTLSIGGDPFDVVLSADNALPHLVDETDLRSGVGRMRAHLRPGGLFLASIRDYDAILREKPRVTPPAFSGPSGGRRVTFQIWDWDAGGDAYETEFFVLRERPERGWQAESRRVRYRAIRRDDLTALLDDGGFESVRWIEPQDSGFFQPIVVGRAAGGA